MFLRNKPVTASPLTLLQQIRLAWVCDRWWAHISRLLRSYVITVGVGKRKLWKYKLWGRKDSHHRTGTAGKSQGWPPRARTHQRKDGTELQHDAARAARSRMVPRAGREAVQTLTACGIPGGTAANCSQKLWNDLKRQLQYASSAAAFPRAGLASLAKSGHQPTLTPLLDSNLFMYSQHRLLRSFCTWLHGCILLQQRLCSCSSLELKERTGDLKLPSSQIRCKNFSQCAHLFGFAIKWWK